MTRLYLTLVFSALWLAACAARAAPAIVPDTTVAAGTTTTVTSFSLPTVTAPTVPSGRLFACLSLRRNSSTFPTVGAVTWNGKPLERAGQALWRNNSLPSVHSAELWSVALGPDDAVSATLSVTLDVATYVIGTAWVVQDAQALGTVIESAFTSTKAPSVTADFLAAQPSSLIVDCTTMGEVGGVLGPTEVGQVQLSALKTTREGSYVSSRVGPGKLGWASVAPGDGLPNELPQVAAEIFAVPEDTPPPSGCPAGTVPGCVVPPMCPADAGPFLPADGGFIDVTAPPYNAACDGVTDDWAALQAAVASDALPKNSLRPILLPGGGRTCMTSRQIIAQRTDGASVPYLMVHGHGRDQSAIRAIDGSPDFQDAAHPKALVYYASQVDCGTSACGEDPAQASILGGNKAFNNEWRDATGDCGLHNPGCKAVDYIASNFGVIRNARFVSPDGSGATAISMLRAYPGPALIKNVECQGFQRCTDTSQLEYTMTLEDVTCSGAGPECVRNAGNSLAIRHLHPGLTTAARTTSTNGLVAMVDSDGAVTGSQFFLRTPSGTEAVSAGPFRAHGSDLATSLHLPVQETPATYADSDPDHWANVLAYGATINGTADDDGVGIRAAIATGKPIVYAPASGYAVWTQVELPPTLRRLNLLASTVKLPTGKTPPSCLFRVSEPGPPLTIERLRASGGYPCALDCSADRVVILLDGSFGASGSRLQLSNGCKVFVENWAVDHVSVGVGTKMWARQLNVEGDGSELITVEGTLWVLGLKTESKETVLHVKAGGCAEIVGGNAYTPVDPGSRPMVIVDEGGQANVSLAQSNYVAGGGYNPVARVTRGGVTLDLPRTALPLRGSGRNAPLIVARNADCAL